MKEKMSQFEFEEFIHEKTQGEIIPLEDFMGLDIKMKFKHVSDNCQGEFISLPRAYYNKGNLCPVCKGKRLSVCYRKSYEFIFQQFQESDLHLLTETYENAHQILEIECMKGHKTQFTYNKFQQGQRCPICTRDKQLQDKKEKAKESLLNILKEYEMKFIKWVNCDDYEDGDSRFIFECSEGHSVERTCHNHKSYKTCPVCTTKAWGESVKGENRPHWKGGQTAIISFLRCSVAQWKQDSMEACGFKCVITHGNFRDIHHLYGFNLIMSETFEITGIPMKFSMSDYTEEELSSLSKICLELHYKYGLGVCLARKPHKQYHIQYGYGNNTPEQFEEFTKNYTQ